MACHKIDSNDFDDVVKVFTSEGDELLRRISVAPAPPRHRMAHPFFGLPCPVPSVQLAHGDLGILVSPCIVKYQPAGTNGQSSAAVGERDNC